MWPACQKRSEETSGRSHSLDHVTAIQRLREWSKQLTSRDFFAIRDLTGTEERLQQFAPSAQTVMPGNRLNHLPFGTSGSLASHVASSPS